MKLLTIVALTLVSTAGVASSLQLQGQGQSQGQGQLQAQSQVGGDVKNKQRTRVNVGGDEARRIPVSTAFAPSINPTATCMGSTTAGGTGMSIGVSVGSSWESENCMYLETARSFEQAGYKSDALAIRCQTSYAKAAPSCKALNRTGGDPYKAEYWTD